MASLECMCTDQGMSSTCTHDSNSAHIWLFIAIVSLLYTQCTARVETDSDDEGPPAMYS